MDQVFQHIFNAHAAFGAATYCPRCLDTNDVFNFRSHPLRLGLGQIHFVQDRHHFQPLFNGGIAVGHRLGFHTLPGVHHQQCPFAGVQRARHFVGKIHMPRGVNEIQLVFLAIPGRVIERDTLGLDGNPSLTLKIHGIQDLFSHFTVSQATTDLDKTICKRGFTMVNVRDNGKVTNSAQFSHRQ